MSNPLPIPAPMELIILSIWTNGRERERTRVSEMYSMCEGKSFPSNKANPYFWIQVSHNMIIMPASALNVSHSPCEFKKHGGAEGEKDVLEQRWRKKGDWIGGSYSGFISVRLLAVSRSSLTLDLLLTTELCDLRIHPPVRTAGSPRVRENWIPRDWSETSV